MGREMGNCFENSIIAARSDGCVEWMNDHARALFCRLGLLTEDSADESLRLCHIFGAELLEHPELDELSLSVQFKGIQISMLRWLTEDSSYLFLIEDSVATSAYLHDILDAVEDPILIFNADGYIEQKNRLIRGMPAVDSDQTGTVDEYGVCLFDFIRGKPRSETVVDKILTGGQLIHSKPLYQPDNSSYIWTGFPLKEEGKVGRVVFTGRDVSRTVNASRAIQDAEKLTGIYLERLHRLKSFFNRSGLIYNSDAMTAIVSTVIKVAPADVPVLIMGESGVGKDVIAEFIYAASNRKDNPFVAVNCSAIPANLIESELFGYEPGAFTGANAKGKRGLFEQANGGTLFLDEIGELSLEIQPKLLRALQEGQITRVGGTTPISLNIRFISATNVSLKDIQSWETFRQDLYYRLSAITIQIPPLRDRREDILPMVYYFLRQFNKEYSKDCRLSPASIDKIYRYQWPGNVRELRSCIEMAVILSDDRPVEPHELAFTEETTSTDAGLTVHEFMDIPQAKALVTELLINKGVAEFHSIPKTAKALGVAPSTIYRKISDGTVHLLDDTVLQDGGPIDPDSAT